jgi:hypothetical protein
MGASRATRSPAALMAGGGGQLGRARKRRQGGFIALGHAEAVASQHRGLRELRHGRQGGWRRAAGLRPVADGGAHAGECM